MTAALSAALAPALAEIPPGVDFGLSVHDLRSGAIFEWRAQEQFHAASLMKLPVLLEALRQASGGELELAASVGLKNQFRSIADGSVFAVDARDDSDPALFARLGQTASWQELLERMIVRSSNLATNLVVERLGADHVTGLCRALGAHDTVVLRGVEDGAAFRAGQNNLTSARDCVLFLRRIAERAVPGAELALEILSRQEIAGGLAALLPASLRVAHKTGSIAAHEHDAGLLLRADGPPIAIAVLTRGFPDRQSAQACIARLARDAWDACSQAG